MKIGYGATVTGGSSSEEPGKPSRVTIELGGAKVIEMLGPNGQFGNMFDTGWALATVLEDAAEMARALAGDPDCDTCGEQMARYHGPGTESGWSCTVCDPYDDFDDRQDEEAVDVPSLGDSWSEATIQSAHDQLVVLSRLMSGATGPTVSLVQTCHVAIDALRVAGAVHS